jgi:Na+-driven multidrug efflux pump
LYAGAVLSLHVWTAVLVFLGVASGRWFILEGHTRAYMGRTLVGVVSNIVFNLLLIPRLGILGAAWATLITQVMVVLAFDLAWKSSRENFWMKCRALWLPRRVIDFFALKHGQLPAL